MGSAVLSDVARAVRTWSMTEGREIFQPSGHVTDSYGQLAFTDEAQRARLPESIHKALPRSAPLILPAAVP